MSGISAAARRELVESVGVRYRSVSASGDKRSIQDEFAPVTGYHAQACHSHTQSPRRRGLPEARRTTSVVRRRRPASADHAVAGVRPDLWQAAQAPLARAPARA